MTNTFAMSPFGRRTALGRMLGCVAIGTGGGLTAGCGPETGPVASSPRTASLAGAAAAAASANCEDCDLCIALGEFQPPAPTPCVTADGNGTCRGVAYTSKVWRQRELRIAFMNGDPRLIERVVNVADEWTRHAGLRFIYNPPGNTHLRIRFVDQPAGGGTSHVGTDNDRVPQSFYTMTLGLSLVSSDRDLRRLVLHEFGHALGLEHEHQNPGEPIPWDEEAVYAHAARAWGWSRGQAQFNIIRRVAAERAQFTAFDRHSIMAYGMAATLRRDRVAIPWNFTLSDFDKTFIGMLYPGANRASAATSFEEGQRLWAAGNAAAAFEAWLPAAQQGLPDAQAAVAYCLQAGLGTARDPAGAARWYRAAAEQGHAISMVGLGVMLEAGTGVTENLPEAVRLFRGAAERGSTDGMFYLAGAYELGLSMPADRAEALRWYGLAARLNHAPSAERQARLRARMGT
jgi:TPR repeat protein